MKKKKLNKLAQLKVNLVACQEERDNLKSKLDAADSILTQISNLVEPNQSYSRRIALKDLPVEVMRLITYRDSIQGAYKPFQQENENYREVIRWLINPKSAEDAAELESYRKQFGPRS